MNYIIAGTIFLKYKLLETKCENYTIDRVSEHDTPDDAWVTYRNGVYNITDFIKDHPGGNYINMALGGDISHYINYFGVHLLNNQFMTTLERYRIGQLVEPIGNNIPIGNSEYTSKMRINMSYPLECEPYYIPFSYITPFSHKYIRNHSDIPEVGNSQIAIYYNDIFLDNIDMDSIQHCNRTDFYNTLQCCGNRIDEKQALKKFNNYDISSKGMIYNSLFSGYSLECLAKPILLKNYNRIGDINHIQFEGSDLYKISVPITYLDNVYIVDKMDGYHLDKEHGGPLRTIVRGTVGCRNVKWINTIRLSSEEADSPWQQNYYRHNGKAINRYPINTIITSHNNKDYVYNRKKITVKGVAYSLNGISSVKVFYDGKWNNAKVHSDNNIYSWNLWEIDLDINDDHKNIILRCKGYDNSGNTQPDTINLDDIYINNSIQRIELIRY